MAEFAGRYRGFVADNIDPEKMMRIKALVPAVNEEDQLTWALPSKDMIGKDRGYYELPAEKDGVWIEFEKDDHGNGQVEFPIYVGTWSSQDDVPQEFIDNYSEKTTLWKDKNGNYDLITENFEEIFRQVDMTIDLMAVTLSTKDFDMLVDGDFTLDADEINLNSGNKGVARLDDKVKSTAVEDSTFWSWLIGFIAVFQTWVPVATDGGLALKTLLTTYLSTNPVPSTLTGKIIEGSGTVKAGD